VEWRIWNPSNTSDVNDAVADWSKKARRTLLPYFTALALTCDL